MALAKFVILVTIIILECVSISLSKEGQYAKEACCEFYQESLEFYATTCQFIFLSEQSANFSGIRTKISNTCFNQYLDERSDLTTIVVNFTADYISQLPRAQEGCIESIDESNKVAVLCNKNHPLEQSTMSVSVASKKVSNAIQKCCSFGDILVQQFNSTIPVACLSHTNSTIPLHLQETLEKFRVQNDDSDIRESTFVHDGIPMCSKYRILDDRLDKWFRIQNDDEIELGIHYFINPVWLNLPPEIYCVDEIEFPCNSTNCFTNGDKNVALIVCEDKIPDMDTYLFHRYLFGISFFVAAGLLLINTIIYILIREHVTPTSWILLSHFVSVGASDFELGLFFLRDLNGLDIEPTVSCVVLMYVKMCLFAILANTCFFVSCEIFRAFWKLSGIPDKAADKRRVIWALVLSWILPVVIFALAFACQYFLEKDDYPGYLGVYEYAHLRCSSLFDFQLRVLLAMQFIIKVTLFFSTAGFIYKHKEKAAFAQENNSQKKFKESVTLYGKLFLTTGMPFSSAFLDWVFGKDDPMSWYWMLLRFAVISLSLYILIVFGLSKKYRKLFMKKYWREGTRIIVF